MLKKILALLVIASVLSCHKYQQQSVCGTGTKVCTDIFVSVGIHFTDNTGKAIAIQNFSAVNQRTHLNLMRTIPQNEMLILGFYIVADDSMLSQLSSDGDDVLVTATDSATNQTKTVTLKISGGCNCHVSKLSGPDTVAFD
jgi:outer membrane lipoprotein-sorting protein